MDLATVQHFEIRVEKYQKHCVDNQPREAFAIALRKKKRAEGRKRHRGLATTDLILPACISSEISSLTQQLFAVKSCLISNPKPDDLLDLLNFIKVLVSMNITYLDLIVTSGLVPVIVLYLNLKFNEKVIEEAALILCNLASGSEICIEALCKHGGVEAFLIVLECDSDQIKENALWGLSNLIAHSKNCFESVVEQGVIKKIHKICKFQNSVSLYETISWVLKNLAFMAELLNPYQIMHLVGIFEKLLRSEDTVVLEETLWGIALMSRNGPDTINLLCECEILDAVLLLIDFFPIQVITICGNICTGTVAQLNFLLGKDLLSRAAPWLAIDKPKVLTHVYWLLSNIVTGGVLAIHKLVSHSIFTQSIISIPSLDSKSLVKASYYIANFMKLATDEKIQLIVNLKIAEILKTFALEKNAEVQKQLLMICEILLDLLGPTEFLQKGCGEALEIASHQESKKLREKTLEIIDSYFNE